MDINHSRLLVYMGAMVGYLAGLYVAHNFKGRAGIYVRIFFFFIFPLGYFLFMR